MIFRFTDLPEREADTLLIQPPDCLMCLIGGKCEESEESVVRVGGGGCVCEEAGRLAVGDLGQYSTWGKVAPLMFNNPNPHQTFDFHTDVTNTLMTRQDGRMS